MTAAEIVALLKLAPHPEGGWYRQTFLDPAPGDRAASTAIYYLLDAGQRSHWHRVDAAEAWHFYLGAPLELSISRDGRTSETLLLGPDLAAGQHPQIVVPRMAWQSAVTTGAFTLAGCTVAPGFRFEGFEMAPPGWEPGR